MTEQATPLFRPNELAHLSLEDATLVYYLAVAEREREERDASGS